MDSHWPSKPIERGSNPLLGARRSQTRSLRNEPQNNSVKYLHRSFRLNDKSDDLTDKLLVVPEFVSLQSFPENLSDLGIGQGHQDFRGAYEKTKRQRR